MACTGADGEQIARVQGTVIERSDRPRLTHAVPVGDATFVAQTVSFVSRTAGLASSRRPAMHDPERSGDGVGPGLEWQVLWLRAVNCEAGERTIGFAVVDGTGRETASFAPPRSIPPGGTYAWVSAAGTPTVVPSGHAVAARWNGMEGAGATGCSWQFAALESPAGRPATVLAAADELMEVGSHFTVDEPGLHASWREAPSGGWSRPAGVTASNCEAGPRQIEAVVLSPDRLVFGELPGARTDRLVDPGASARWAPAQLLLPPGWSIGVRWSGMAGSGHTCAWSGLLRVVRVG